MTGQAAREFSQRMSMEKRKPKEIEVTPAMSEAGENALLEALDRAYPDLLAVRAAAEAVRQVFLEMRKVEISRKTLKSLAS